MHRSLLKAEWELSTSLLITMLNLLAKVLEIILQVEWIRLMKQKFETFSRVPVLAISAMLT